MKRYIFQVKLCARQFKTEINPDTAAEVLLLADRHCLESLKQVTTKDQNQTKPNQTKQALPRKP